MYTVFIAICLSTTSPQACQQPTALHWVIAPESQGDASGCMVHGMQYAAQSNLVGEGTYAKIFCKAGSGAVHADADGVERLAAH